MLTVSKGCASGVFVVDAVLKETHFRVSRPVAAFETLFQKLHRECKVPLVTEASERWDEIFLDAQLKRVATNPRMQCAAAFYEFLSKPSLYVVIAQNGTERVVQVFKSVSVRLGMSISTHK
jgi:hypothetical protein